MSFFFPPLRIFRQRLPIIRFYRDFSKFTEKCTRSLHYDGIRGGICHYSGHGIGAGITATVLFILHPFFWIFRSSEKNSHHLVCCSFRQSQFISWQQMSACRCKSAQCLDYKLGSTLDIHSLSKFIIRLSCIRFSCIVQCIVEWTTRSMLLQTLVRWELIN